MYESATYLVEVAEDLASDVFPMRLFMVHNARRCRENHETERTSRKHG